MFPIVAIARTPFHLQALLNSIKLLMFKPRKKLKIDAKLVLQTQESRKNELENSSKLQPLFLKTRSPTPILAPIAQRRTRKRPNPQESKKNTRIPPRTDRNQQETPPAGIPNPGARLAVRPPFLDSRLEKPHREREYA